MKIDLVVGARPNFVKAAALVEAAKVFPEIQLNLVHTGQHKGIMSDPYWKELGLPEPSEVLESESGAETGGQRFADMISGLVSRWAWKGKPDFIMVVGDTDSTAAGAIAAAKSGIPVIHVEAGLRCGDMGMQEEINRILVDSVASILYTTSEWARDNLIREGHDPSQCRFVGNVMVDTLFRHIRAAKTQYSHKGQYAVLTLHRAENVDNKQKLASIIAAVDEVGSQIPIVFPIHPRTKRNWTASAWNIDFVLPMGYLEFISLLAGAKFVMTDSGGVQEETTALGVPCLTLRESTERPETVGWGSNWLIGTDPVSIIAAAAQSSTLKGFDYSRPPLWDGHAAERIMKDLVEGA